MEDIYQWEDEYRDSIATVDAEGKRIWIHPKKPKGQFHNARIIVTIVLLALLFTGPFLKVDGHPLFLFNFIDRTFIIFGIPFWPQDFVLFGLAMITFFVFIILFTVVFGRVWCGWACPQTLFMEMVFRKIEYWIEGDANQQRKLNRSPWNTDKIIKKVSKQLIFIAISVLIAHTLMAYLVGLDRTIELVSSPPAENLSGFLGIVFFTGVFWWVFAYFREQACIAACPYGRLQGVLLGKDSLVVSYDWNRGEPRGKIKKNQVQEDKGDCVDCKLCVHVCPTGIDIRNGTQLECVNCTACIDACDDVMLKVKKPKGLIRLASFNMVKEGSSKFLTPRVAGYSGLLGILLVILTTLLVTRADVEATVLRVPGTLYTETEDGFVSNLYNIQLINKTFEDIDLEVKIENSPGSSITKIGDQDIHVPSNGIMEGVFLVKIPKENIQRTKTELSLGFYFNEELITTEKTNFFGPTADME